MRTSKKLLSLFLALVMIITGSSLGLTAYAADGNQTDQNLHYWNDKTDAEAAFQSIDSLLAALLQIDAIKNLLQDNNIVNPVTQTTTLSDVVQGASPMLLGLLGGLGDLNIYIAQVEVSWTKEKFLGFKYSDYETQKDLYDKWYTPLDTPEDDESDLLTFYQLYGICYENKDADGDLGTWCTDTLAALDALFDSLGVPEKEEEPEIEVGELTKMKAYLQSLWEEATADLQGQGLLTFTKEDIGNATVNGKLLKETPLSDLEGTDGEIAIEYYTNVMKENGIAAPTNLAELLYYAINPYELLVQYYDLYFNLMDEAGATVNTSHYPDATGTTADELEESFKNFYTYDFLVENGMLSSFMYWDYYLDLWMWDDHDRASFDEYYRAMLFGALFLNDWDSYDDSAWYAGSGMARSEKYNYDSLRDVSSPYYKEITTGLAKLLGADEADFAITDAQLEAIYNAAAAGTIADGAGLAAYAEANLNAAAASYINAMLDLDASAVDSFVADLAAAGSYSDALNVELNNSEASVFTDHALVNGGLRRLQTMAPSQWIVDNKIKPSYNGDKDYYMNSAATSALNVFEVYNTYVVNPDAAPEEPEEPDEPDEPDEPEKIYFYKDYAVPAEHTVPIVNSLINKFMPVLDNDLVKSVVLGLLETPVDLKASLTDVWQRLYDDPSETLFELLPVLTVVIDEILLPTLFHDDDYQNAIEGMVFSLLGGFSQAQGSDIGLGCLHLDLNKSLPAILSWLTGDKAAALDYIGYEFYGPVAIVDGEGNPVLDENGEQVYKEYNSQVPKFTNIYIVDGIIAQLSGAQDIAGLIAGLIYKAGDDATDEEIAAIKQQQAQLTALLSEPLQEILVFLKEAVLDAKSDLSDHVKYGFAADGMVPAQTALNDLPVSLPYLINRIGQNFNEKYNVDSDWTFLYDGKIETKTFTLGEESYEALANMHIKAFKDYAIPGSGATSADILTHVVDLLIGNWVNSLLDFLNDMIDDENNDISYNVPLLQGLLDALGGLDDDSIITDALNGLFQLKRSDAASFTLTRRTEANTIDAESKTNFSGFSITSGFYLINNLMYFKDGEIRGLIPFIKGIIENNEAVKADYDLDNAFASVGPYLAASSKNKSAAGTNYSELLTASNEKAAQKLVDVLDTVLSSVLSNAELNGFTLDSTENLLSGAVSLASAYLGQKNTNDILVLINDYLYYVCGESTANPNKWNVIGNYPTKGGDVDYKRVYTSANLSNLVIQTYSLLENIIDYLFYNEDSGFLVNRDPNMLIADALYGIVSPDAVGIRLDGDKYAKTKEILAEKDYLNWNSFKVKVTAAYYAKKQYNTIDYLKFGFKDGDKDAFYDALGESLSGVAGVLGAVLTKTYVDSEHKQNWYSNIINPIFSSLANAVGSEVPVMAAADFNTAKPGSQLVNGFIRPLGGILAPLYDAPFSFILNLVKGLAGVLDDNSIMGILGSVLMPVDNHILGLTDNIIRDKLACPTLGYIVKKLAIRALYGDQIAAGIPYYNIKLDDADLADPKEGVDILVKLKGASLGFAGKDILVNIVNDLIGDSLGGIQLPAINWQKLATAKNPAQVLLLVYGYVVDTVLNSDLLSGILDSLDPQLAAIIEQMSAAQILALLSEVISAVNSPVEVYWTFKEYAGKLTNTFTYPKGINDYKANKAVGQLDNIVKNVFPLLNGFGVTDIEGLDALVRDKLYTNEIITTIAKALYGALSGNDTVVTVLGALSLDVSPAGVAAYLTDKSYGPTYSSAASTLKSAKSWDKVTSVNWGFKNGSASAQDGFIKGLAAALRPLNNVLGVLLAENKLDITKIDIRGLLNSLAVKGSTELGEGENGATLTYELKNGTFLVTIQSHNIQFNDKRTRKSVLEIDVDAVAKDIEDLLAGVDIGFGTNGYESAIIPILEAFLCDDIKTYKEYKADYAKAKDNLIINILKPIGGLLNKLVDKPFDTLTAILPNVAYFIDNGGVEQAVGNLLAPITAKDGLLGVLAKNGLDIDELIYMITKKDLGTIVSDLLADKLGIEADIQLDLSNLAASNIHEIVIPLVINLLKDKLGITLPEFTWADIAKHGEVKTVASKALNDEGAYTTLQVQANQGEVLVAVLRYVADVLIKNAQVLKEMITGLDAIKNNATLKSIVESIFDQIAQADKDDIVRAIFYLLCGEPTDSFFDYRNFKIGDYEFSFGDLDEDFCRQLAPMLDGLIGGLLEGGLTKLVEDNLYKDDLVAKIATGLYGAVEGVKVGDNTLTNILAMTDIDFTTGNVAALLTNEKYGRTYADAASTIRSAGSWKNVKAENLHFGVTDRDSFLRALTAVLRPLFGVLDVILNDASLNLFDLVSIPGSDGYTSTIVPLLEALGVYNIKTQYQYREDCFKQYDSLLLDILNPLWDKVEDILAAPLEVVANILPNLALFFGNDGLIQLVENLLTPVSALLDALRPIVDVNSVLKAAGLDVPKLLKDKVGLSVSKFDLYDLSGTLKPLVGADNVVGTINSVLKVIKISGQPLGIELPEIDWLKLASCGEYQMNATSQVATYGGRIAVEADEDEALITVLRFLVETINYKDNYDAVSSLVSGLLGGASETVAGVVDQVLGLLQGDTDEVIQSLVELLQALAG